MKLFYSLKPCNLPCWERSTNPLHNNYNGKFSIEFYYLGNSEEEKEFITQGQAMLNYVIKDIQTYEEFKVFTETKMTLWWTEYVNSAQKAIDRNFRYEKFINAGGTHEEFFENEKIFK
jgi:hypothetical protein